MDVIQANHNWHCCKDEPAEQSLFLEAPGLCDAYRDLDLLPRIGDQYQVEIPALVPQPVYLKLTEIPIDAIILPGTAQSFLMGKPVSITWINEEAEHKPIGFPGDLNGKFDGNASAMQSQETKNEMHQPCEVKGHLVPGSTSQSWSDVEEAGFLLGLYIFGKSLVQVKRFVGSKKMEDIQSFYYGKFYRSARYRRWSECRKLRSRRCIFGQKIFTGWRQQELLSRLLADMTEERKTALLEVAKTFGEGKISLEEYVFTVKSLVGLSVLVEAVGIGKGKQDLTGLAIEPSKSNQAATIRPEIPISKAFSSLTPIEIISVLNGGSRLSKARSCDLFWEAVWPRLLARGWNSEQPKDYFTTTNRNSLVFLTPGIKKFSRRKLVKGDHYFDSVADVLNKVASDSALLELDTGADTGVANKEENGWTDEANSKRGDFPDKQRHCYLKPRNPVQITDTMQFTVVDTSLGSQGTNKVRELRSLPIEMKNISASSGSDSEDSDGDFSKDAIDDSEFADNLSSDRNGTSISRSTKKNIGKRISLYKNLQKAPKHNGLAKGSEFTGVPVKVPKDQKVMGFEDFEPRKAIKGHNIRGIKPGGRKLVAFLEERLQSLISHGQLDSSSDVMNDIVGPQLNQEEVGGSSGNPVFVRNIYINDDPLKAKSSSSSSLFRMNSDVSDQHPRNNLPCAEIPCEKPPCRTWIDLNIPPSPEDTESEALRMETERQHNKTSGQPEDTGTQSAFITACNTASGQPPNMNSRRHSMRSRPPTAKALEAFATGYYSSLYKRKSKDDFPPQDNSMSKPSQRPRTGERIRESFNAAIMNFQEYERGDGAP